MNIKKKQNIVKKIIINKRTLPSKKKVKRIKYKRVHKGRVLLITNTVPTGNLRFGTIGIAIMKPTWLDEKKLEFGRKIIRKFLPKKNPLWIRVFPDIPITKKPTGIRMGKGKGKPHNFVAKVRAGSIIYEMDNISSKTVDFILERLKKAWTLSFQSIRMD